jgi:hypothetical protein
MIGSLSAYPSAADIIVDSEFEAVNANSIFMQPNQTLAQPFTITSGLCGRCKLPSI